MSASPCHSWRSFSLDRILSALQNEISASPSFDDLVYILLKCRKERDEACASRLHAYMRTYGLEDHRTLGNYLVPMLVDVGNLHGAQQVFDKLQHPNEWSWEGLIDGYIKCGNPLKALTLYQKLEKDESVCLSGRVLVLLLKACTTLKDITNGIQVHCAISRFGLLERDVYVGSMLVDMYVKCGSLAKAHHVFSKLPQQDVVAWTTIIAGYTEYGYGEHAIEFYDLMRSKGVRPNAVTFVCILKACGSLGATDEGGEIHDEIVRQGLLEKSIILGNASGDMYSKCGFLEEARDGFDKLSAQNVVSCNALLAGYVMQRQNKEVLLDYKLMSVEENFETKKGSPSVPANRRFHANDSLIGRTQSKCTNKKTNTCSYQMKILGNAIVDLETGCGKTLIAILLIKEMACSMREKNEQCRAIFTALTVCLTLQQTTVLGLNWELHMECYYGAKGVDKWSATMWKEEMNANEVYHNSQMSAKPQTLDMAALLVITSKGLMAAYNSEVQIWQLKKLLEAKVSLEKDNAEVQDFVSASKNNDGFGEDEELNKKPCKKLRKLHGCLLYSLEDLEHFCRYKSALCLLKKIKIDMDHGEGEDEKVQNSKETF